MVFKETLLKYEDDVCLLRRLSDVRTKRGNK